MTLKVDYDAHGDPAEIVHRDPRYAPKANAETIALCRTLRLGDRVFSDGHRNAWTVQARSLRYVVITKPMNAKRTVTYSVIDLELGIKGTDNYHGLGYETREACEKSLAKFHDWQFAAEISVRNNATIDVVRVDRPTEAQLRRYEAARLEAEAKRAKVVVEL